MYNAVTILPIISFFISVFVWTYVYAQHNKAPVSKTFLLFTANASGWLATEMIVLFPISYGFEIYVYKISSIFGIPIGFWYLEFANAVAQRRRTIVSYIAAVISIIFVFFTIFTDLVLQGTVIYSWGAGLSCHPVFHTIVSANTAFFTALGLFYIIKKRIAASDEEEKRIIELIIFGTVVAMVSIALLNVVLPNFFNIEHIPRFGATAMSVFLLLVFYAVMKYRFLSISLDKAAEGIFEHVKVGILLLDRDNLICRINKEAVLILGDSTLIGKSASEVFWGIDISEELTNREIKLDKTADERVLTLSSSYVSHKHQVLGKVLMVQDVTDQKRAETILRKSNDELEKEVENRTRQLRHAQKMETIGNFAGGIAHDFNNSLAVILGFGNAAKKDLPPDNPVREDLDEIILAANRGKEMVKQIMLLARKEDKADFQVTNLSLLLSETLDLLRISTPSNIRVKTKISINNAFVKCSPTQISRVIINIYNNALHAMKEKNSAELSISLMNSVISKSQIGDNPYLKSGMHAELVFRDNGIGIAPEYIQNIFDPFFTTKSREEGTGLGLASSQVIVNNHDGKIAVESIPGKGSAFTVYLPTHLFDSGKYKAVPESALKSTNRGNEYVLWVDDDIQMLRMGNRMLSQMGYNVITAKDGTEALEKFKNDMERFALVVTDYNMPNMNGTQLAEELKKAKPNLPIILVSGFGEQISSESIESGGITAFLEKPILPEELGRLIRSILNEQLK